MAHQHLDRSYLPDHGVTDTRVALTSLRQWVYETMPTLNSRVDARQMTPRAFAHASASALEPMLQISPVALSILPQDLAREAMGVVGFAVCSIEHHTQSRRRRPGFGMRMIDGLEDVLAALSIASGLPPNLGLHSYWLNNNTHEPLSFTGDPMEGFFRKMVVEVNYLHERTAELLRPIVSGGLKLENPRAVRILEQAAQLQKQVHDCYAEFRVSGPAARENMTIEFFRDTMRTYLVAFPVHGTIVRSANAANIKSQASLDFVLGTVEPFYISHVAERMHYMTVEEQNELRADMTSGSVLEWILSAAELGEADVRGTDKDPVRKAAMVERLRARHDLRPALAAYASVVRNAANASGAHFGLIMAYLVKPDVVAGQKLAVDSGHGTGGRSHDETKRVMRMRSDHPIAKPLADAIVAAGKGV